MLTGDALGLGLGLGDGLALGLGGGLGLGLGIADGLADGLELGDGLAFGKALGDAFALGDALDVGILEGELLGETAGEGVTDFGAGLVLWVAVGVRTTDPPLHPTTQTPSMPSKERFRNDVIGRATCPRIASEW